MKKISCITTCFLLSTIAFSQYKWDAGIMLGASNYLGEMGGKEKPRRDFILDLKFSQTRSAVGGFVRYKLNPDIYVRGALGWYRISGADRLSTNPGRRGRNLSFRNDIYDASVVGQYIFYDVADLGRTYRYRNDFKAYIFTGFTGFYHNPKANYQGEWVALSPLHTEGQGIIAGAPKPYSKFQIAIPAGVGFFFTIDKRYRIGWEFNWRTTFTDYLDDVSTTYPDPAALGNPLAAALSNRNPELGEYDPETTGIAHPNNFTPGNKRGDPTHKDSYLSTTINASYVLKQKSKFAKAKYKTFFKGKKYMRRVIRAKF
jgi:hypothetical protein